jgi:hypothetical protein
VNEVVIVGDDSWQIIAVWFKKSAIGLHDDANFLSEMSSESRFPEESWVSYSVRRCCRSLLEVWEMDGRVPYGRTFWI